MHEKFSTDAPPEVAFLTPQAAWAYGWSQGRKSGIADARRIVDAIFPPDLELSPEVSDDEG